MKSDSYSTPQFIKDIGYFLKPYWLKFTIATLLKILSEILGLYPPYALASIVTFFTTYSQGKSLQPFYTIMLIWIISSLIKFGVRYIGNYWGYQVSERIAIDAQVQTMRRMFFLDIAWHEKENAGNKLKKIDRGSGSLDDIGRLIITDAISIVVNLVGVILIISKFDLKIALWTIAFLVTYFFIARAYTSKALQAVKAANTAEEDMSGLLYESVNNIRSVKVMSMIEPLYDMIYKQSVDVYQKIAKRIFWYQSSGSVKNAWSQIFQLGMLAFIGLGVAKGRYEVGFIILFYNYYGNVLSAVSDISDAAQDYAVSKTSIGRMMDILDTPIEIDNENNKVTFPKDWKKIRVENLSFAYGDKKVLHSVSFEINRGEKIGIIGLSGAGKSTLFKMLLKEREDYDGDIFIDDIPLRQIGKKSYFDHTAVVLQDTEVFNFSLLDNVTISNNSQVKNTELLGRSLEIAHVRDFADALTEGLDTLIGEKGVRLSGGEKQRVGIARAVFKQPDILLLDEATSHLDIESEEVIRDSLHQFFKTVTAVVIAHRLTTIKEMDRILVLEDGKILESGSFEQLYSKKGRFYDLWEKQKL